MDTEIKLVLLDPCPNFIDGILINLANRQFLFLQFFLFCVSFYMRQQLLL